MYKSIRVSNAFVAMLVFPWVANSFQGAPPSHILHTRNVPGHASPGQQRSGRSTALRVVADRPMEKEDEKRIKFNDNRSRKSWIERNGGFVPNLKGRLRPSLPLEVKDMYQYKDEVVDVEDCIVCVRFYAPWCRACKAIESKFRRLSKEYPSVKFVEVPVTKESALLHQALQIPSLPYAHIYEPSVGLVEERKINKKVFDEFKSILKTYVNGECELTCNEHESNNRNLTP